MSQAGIINIAGGGGGGSPVQTLTAEPSGTVVPPTANNINIASGTGISVTGNAGTSTITITATAAGFAWTDEAVSFNAFKENGYFVTASGVTATLPASNSQGDTIEFIVTNATEAALTIQAAGGAVIRINTMTSSVNGSATNATAGDAMELIYQAASNEWWALSREGVWKTV
jgi:predicted RNase H-like HicB family nuclease